MPPQMIPAPDDYSLDDVAPATTAQGDDYPLEAAGAPETPPTHAVEQPTGDALSDAGNFMRTAAIKAVTGLAGIAPPEAPQYGLGPDPVNFPPDPAGLADAAFNSRLGPEYQPQTTAGRYGMAAATAALPAALMPAEGAPAFLLNLARGAAVGAGGQRMADAGLPPWLSTLAVPGLELLTRGGIGAAVAGVKAGVPFVANATRAIVNPSEAGAVKAAAALQGVDNSYPGIASPSDAEASGAQGAVQSATGAIGPGASPYAAGQQIRGDLTGNQDALTTARTGATAPIAAARDASTATVDTDPVINLINQKLTTAAGSQASAINGALNDLKMPSGALRQQADQLAASRQAINARISAAKSVGDNGSVSHLLDIRSALDGQVNAAVPEAGQFNQTFQAMSRPLDVFQPGQSVNAVPNAVARDNFGNLNGTPPSEIPDSFLTGSGVKEKLDQLVSAYGGDKTAAESGLEQHLAGVAQTAVNPDGTLNPGAFAKAMQPYQEALNGNAGMWFPQLRAKFATAQAAQNTLDTMTAQRGIAQSMAQGGLRDPQTGTVTASSFNGWLKSNKAQLAQSQPPGAVMRLQAIGNALTKAQSGGGAEAATTELLPAAIGAMTNGVEGAIEGTMLHKTISAVANKFSGPVNAAYNAALERAIQDPVFAQQLAEKLPNAPYTQAGITKTFANALGNAPVAAPTTALIADPRSASAPRR